MRRESPVRHELAALLVLVATLLSWRLVTDLFATGGSYHSFWWPPTAAVVLFLLRRRPAAWTLPAAFVALWATGTAGPDTAPLADPLATAALVAGLGVGLGALRLTQRRVSSGGPGELSTFVVATAVLGPVLGRLLGGAGPTSGLADAAAVLAFVPFVVGLLRRGVTSEPLRLGAVWAAVGVVTALAVPLDGTGTAVLVVLPLLGAGATCPRRCTSATIVATGLALVARGVTSPVAEVAPGLTALFVAGAAAGLLISGLRTGLDEAEPLAPQPVLRSLEAELPSPLQDARRFARLLRHARLATIAVTSVAVVAVQFGLLAPTGDVSPLGVLLAVAGPYLLVNALSKWLDTVPMPLERRDLIESIADAGAVYIAHVALSVLLPEVLLQASTVWVALLAGARLRTRAAIGVAGSYLVATIATWALVPLPAPTAAAAGLGTVVLTCLGAVFAGTMVHVVVRQLVVSREAATAAALEIDRLQLDLTESEAALRAEHAAAIRQEQRLAVAVQDLTATNEQLEQARARLEQFTAVLAHDLRSPLSSAAMAARTLANPDVPDALVGRVRDGLLRATDRAVRLVDQLYGHATASSTELQRASTDLNVVLRGVLDDLSAGIVGSGTDVRQEGLLARVVCDPVLVGQLLQNLVANALHHATVDGVGPTVTVAGAWQDDGYLLTVSDDGPGFGDGAVDVFAAGVRDRAGEHHGLGLGLATCQEVVQRHGGRIWAEATPGGGATFCVLLPATPPDVVHVLVVEDDEDLRLVYRHALSSQLTGRTEVVVTEAGGVAEAERLLADGGPHPFDAVLVDVDLPDGSGTELIDLAQQVDVPLHVVTGHHRRAAVELEDALARGVPVTRKSDVLGSSGPELRSRLLGSVV